MDNVTSKCILKSDEEKGGVCWPGTFCEEGSYEPQECPAGKYLQIFFKYVSTWFISLLLTTSIKTVFIGYYCDDWMLSEPSGQCNEGYFCLKESKSSEPLSGLCPRGFYCPKGTGTPQPCPQGTYSDLPSKLCCLSYCITHHHHRINNSLFVL